MRTAATILMALLGLACASAEREGEMGTTGEDAGPVVSTVEIVNTSGFPVTVSARVGNSAEQRLGFLGPGESSIFRVPTGASPTDDLYLRAQGPDGREIGGTVDLTGNGPVRWEVPPLP